MAKNSFTAGPDDVQAYSLLIDVSELNFLRAICQQSIEDNKTVPESFEGNVLASDLLKLLNGVQPAFISRSELEALRRAAQTQDTKPAERNVWGSSGS